MTQYFDSIRKKLGSLMKQPVSVHTQY